MALRITKASDPIVIENILVLIYGQPGSGKSTLGFMSNKPLLFDFDKGAKRSHYRKEIVEIDSWDEIITIDPKDVQGYDTIIIDTIGRAIDLLTQFIMRENPKLRRSDGSLTLQGFGAMKLCLTNWLKMLLSLKKDIILIAHDKEDKDGDNRIFRPDISGGSYSEILKTSDFVGYIYKYNNASYIDFNPNDRFIGKNSATFSAKQIPHHDTNPFFMGELINEMKLSLGTIGNSHIEIAEFIKQYSDLIGQVTNVTELNNAMIECRQKVTQNPKFKGKVSAISLQIKAHLEDKASELNAEYHTEEKIYYSKDSTQGYSEEPETPPTEETNILAPAAPKSEPETEQRFF